MADDLEQKYLALVERIRRMPYPEADKVAILADLEAIYRRERAEAALKQERDQS